MTQQTLTSVDEGRSARPIRRRLRVAAIILTLLALAVAGLWIARRPIAGLALHRELKRAGVPARYEVETLDLGRQRLRNVVIGDPARPDLVADWIETGTRLTWSGATVTAVRAGEVRLRVRLVDGRVSLGAVDRLLGPPSGEPFALPRLFVDVADARIRLETSAGLVGVKLSGRGRLDDGFDGRLAAVAERLVLGGCEVGFMTVAVRLRTDDASPELSGPVGARSLRCDRGLVQQVRADLDAVFGPTLDSWRGRARLATGAVRTERFRAAELAGTVSFDGSARATEGRLDIAVAGVAHPDATARRLALAGEYRIGDTLRFAGRVSGSGVSVDGLDADSGALAGTPVGPLVAQAAQAAERAVRAFGFDTRLAVDTIGGLDVHVSELAARSTSGARLLFDGDDGVRWSPTGLRLDTRALLSGGGLPDMRVELDQASPGAPIRGLARVASYAAGEASLALQPVAFTATPGGATRITTTATLSGPLGGGRVEGLSAPLTLLWDGGGRLAANPDCTPVSFRRFAIGGLALAPARLRLCPTDGALLRFVDGRVTGGASIAAPRLSGRIGSTPVILAASGGGFALADQDFVVRDLAARLGAPGRVTRIDVGRLEGRIAGDGVGGRFTAAGGRIANIPLLLSEAGGAWRLQGGVMTIDGGATVTDAEGRRFEPLRSDDLALRLADNRIAVTGTLRHPPTGAGITDVRIAHDLSRGSGEALLAVPGVVFDERLQPEALTRLTFGVVADVRGRVEGRGRIAWNPEGVTSTGVFSTPGLDLAAAFGPVQGLSTTIRFDDLLALRSEPGQVATIRVVNPGVPVTDGVVRYRTLPESRVQVEGGRWPFAGGVLTLEPSLLDFGRPRPKALTFSVAGVQAAQFLQQFDFDNLNAAGVFDGVLPMVFDERGGRIGNGRLTVREGGGTIAYVGAVTQEDVGFWGNLAFQALKSIRYRDLDIVMNGPLSGEMVTQVRFEGVSQGEGTKSNFLIRRLQRLPFVFNIRIKAPFRGLLDSARSFYDPRRLIQRNLPALMEEQNRRTRPPRPDIQPPASRMVP